MDRRRGPSNRAASTEEVECWSHAAKSISTFSNMYTETENIIERVNRLISGWPTDDALQVDGLESAKKTYKKLTNGLHGIRDSAEKEIKAIDDALESLDILIALRNASEAPEKRNKRPRGLSPSSSSTLPSTPIPTPINRPVSSGVALRNSVGPSAATPFSREPKARKDALAKQLPLQEGRKVAFHPPAGKPGEATDADENTWILAVVTKCFSQDKNRYEVQDAEPQEDGQPGQYYNTTIRSIIPLPDPSAPPSGPAHLNAYQEFPAKSIVLALYPDTSCFYRAEVIASPRDMQPSGRVAPSSKYLPTYKLKFEDDDDQEHSVAAQWVVEWPGS